MLVYLPCLHKKMLQKQATNEALAIVSGVCMSSIARCRSKGTPMQLHNAIAVYQTLNTCSFKYEKRGQKLGARWRWKKGCKSNPPNIG